MKDYFLIAKITSVFGKEGYVKIEPYSDFPERFFELKMVFIDFWGDKKKLEIEKVRQLNNAVALKFRFFNDERDAGIFIGREMYVEEKDLVKLPEQNYFIHDLIGSKVFQNDDEIGEVTDVLSPPANDVIVILGKEKKEILIPLVPDFIDKFDPEKKILILKSEMDFNDED
ncbi:MAG: 16S rRNA processing protein RimM [Ignavibacterium sp.]|nr:MAG: 16S rRNA processing protein RimM [Ignavibacterium sp.]